jgi:glycosyltransferase involved in cell wall biosynthesis
MKILLINDNGYQTGGAEKYILNLKSCLINRHEVKLFSANSPNSESDYSFKSSVNSFRKYSDQVYNLDSYRKLKSVLKLFQPDIIHINNIDKKISPSILHLCENIPTVMTIHDYDLIYPGAEYADIHDCKLDYGVRCPTCTTLKSYILFRLKNLIRIPILKKYINIIIAPNKFMYKRVASQIKDIELTILNYGIYLNEFMPLKESKQILFVGRLEKVKGIYTLIYSFIKISKIFKESRLLIAGDGKEMDNLFGLVKKLKLKNVTFTGWLKDEELLALYESSDVLILPSIWDEPFGLVGIEAMSGGRPVIASRVGGIPDWLDDGKTGYLVDPGMPDQIAEKVIKLFSDRNLLIQMGKNARKRAEQFSIEKHVEEIEKIYEQVIAKYNSKNTSLSTLKSAN